VCGGCVCFGCCLYGLFIHGGCVGFDWCEQGLCEVGCAVGLKKSAGVLDIKLKEREDRGSGMIVDVVGFRLQLFFRFSCLSACKL